MSVQVSPPYGELLHGTCFNTSYVSVQDDLEKELEAIGGFQYILCVGSRHLSHTLRRHFVSFNTSYVSVQVNKENVEEIPNFSFNTSYVSVQESYAEYVKRNKNSFNTSYVSVQGKKK